MPVNEALILLLIAAGALAAPLLSERIGWFSAPCEALYGALVATFVPQTHNPSGFVSGLAQLSFLLLMFLAGLEIDFTMLRERGPKALARALAVVLSIQAAAVGLTLLLRLPPIMALLGGAISVSLLLVVLQQQGMSRNPFGQQVLLIASLGELVTIFALTGYDLVVRHGFDWTLALAALKLLALLLVGGLTLSALTWLAQEHPGRVARLFRLGDTTEVGVRAALALMLAFVALAALLGVEQILATFIAGMVTSYAFRRQRTIAYKLMTIGQGFFLPIFFITAGMSLRLTDMLNWATLAQLLLLLGIIAFSHALAAPLLRWMGLKWTEAIASALLLSAPLTLLVATAQVGINLGQLSPAAQGVAIGAAVVSAIVFPLLARPLVRRAVSPSKVAPLDAHVAPLIGGYFASPVNPAAIGWRPVDEAAMKGAPSDRANNPPPLRGARPLRTRPLRRA